VTQGENQNLGKCDDGEVEGSSTIHGNRTGEDNSLVQEEVNGVHLDAGKAPVGEIPKVDAVEIRPERTGDVPFCTRCRETEHYTRDCSRLGRGGGRHAGQGSGKQDLIEFVAPLCATQVDGQAFFLIPSRSCEVNARERVNTSVV
jgi:hypothetical protein